MSFEAVMKSERGVLVCGVFGWWWEDWGLTCSVGCPLHVGDWSCQVWPLLEVMSNLLRPSCTSSPNRNSPWIWSANMLIMGGRPAYSLCIPLRYKAVLVACDDVLQFHQPSSPLSTPSQPHLSQVAKARNGSLAPSAFLIHHKLQALLIRLLLNIVIIYVVHNDRGKMTGALLSDA